MPLVNFTPVNPATTTREAFTKNINDVAIPTDAHESWAGPVRHQQGLYQALYDHEAMTPNRQQTFNTPANQKSRVYHTWDFVGRTLQFLYMTDYKKAPGERRGRDKEVFQDAVGRAAMSQILVEDTSSKADMMLNANIDVDVEFGEAVKAAAAAT